MQVTMQTAATAAAAAAGATTATPPRERPAPSPAELPVLVGHAKNLVQIARDKATTPVAFLLEEVRDYLGVLPLVINRAVAVDGIDRGVFWALEGTRILARTARVKTEHLLARQDAPLPERRRLHDALLAQLDLVLERVRNAEQLVRRPWPS